MNIPDETKLTPQEIKDYVETWGVTETYRIDWLTEHAAEKAYPEGMKEGRRQVIRELEEHSSAHDLDHTPDIVSVVFTWARYQELLKELG